MSTTGTELCHTITWDDIVDCFYYGSVLADYNIPIVYDQKNDTKLLADPEKVANLGSYDVSHLYDDTEQFFHSIACPEYVVKFRYSNAVGEHALQAAYAEARAGIIEIGNLFEDTGSCSNAEKDKRDEYETKIIHILDISVVGIFKCIVLNKISLLDHSAQYEKLVYSIGVSNILRKSNFSTFTCTRCKEEVMYIGQEQIQLQRSV